MPNCSLHNGNLRYFRPVYLEWCLKTDAGKEKHTKPGISTQAAVISWHCLKSEGIFAKVQHTFCWTNQHWHEQTRKLETHKLQTKSAMWKSCPFLANLQSQMDSQTFCCFFPMCPFSDFPSGICWAYLPLDALACCLHQAELGCQGLAL